MDRIRTTRTPAWASFWPGTPGYHGFLAAIFLAASAAILAGCGESGGSDPRIAVSPDPLRDPPLPEWRDTDNLYRPYFATGDLNRPRYYQEVILTERGTPIAIGGTDERGFSAIAAVEAFDHAGVDRELPRPDSGTGQWIDTDFEGDPMALPNGGRLLSTLSRLAEGRILVSGGTQDFLEADPIARAELFDPDTRTFAALDRDMVEPRFRHTAITLPGGDILIAGGQKKDLVGLFDDVDIFVGMQRQVPVFRSLRECEVYSPEENEFQLLTLPDSTRPSSLFTPRGRTGHAAARLAGPDQTLDSADDIVLIAGGMQTLNGQFAPRTKFLGAVARFEAAGLVGIEFFDPLTRVWTQAANVQLASPRLNEPHIMNLGEFNDFTLDGVKGLGNLVLITHGDADAICPTSVLEDEVLLANYTGFGPTQGLQFLAVLDASTGNQSRVQGFEYFDPTTVPPLDLRAGRSGAQPVNLRRRLQSPSGETSSQTWTIAAAGVSIIPIPAGCAYLYDAPTISSGCVFDPYFSFPAWDRSLSPRDLNCSRSMDNPLGIIGCWLTLDGNLPGGELPNPKPRLPPNFREQFSINQWAQSVAFARVFHAAVPVAGPDAVIGTFDDRVLLAGGGDDYGFFGGEATAPSCEILLPPGVNHGAPAD